MEHIHGKVASPMNKPQQMKTKQMTHVFFFARHTALLRLWRALMALPRGRAQLPPSVIPFGASPSIDCIIAEIVDVVGASHVPWARPVLCPGASDVEGRVVHQVAATPTLGRLA